MEPITLVVGALSAGAAVVGTSVMTEAAKDAYNKLKAGVVERFKQNEPMVEGAIVKLEQDPQAWEVPLERLLTTSGIALTEDDQLINFARALKSALPAQAVTGAVTFNITQEGENAILQPIGTMTGGTVIGRQDNSQP